MQLTVIHETSYDYTPVVETAHHMACLQPIHTDHQTRLSHQLDIHPAPAQCSEHQDVFGNHKVFFNVLAPHETLRVTATTQVLTTPAAELAASAPWELVREAMAFNAGKPHLAASEFVFASPHVQPHPDFSAYALPSFSRGADLMQAAQALMQRMHREFTYASQSTEINTPAREALHQRQGVCQDFAHIFIACLRSLGLPARYVSGYLLTQPPPGKPRLIGSDASHAWASVYLLDPQGQGLGWYDLDPTNNRCGLGTPGEDYVTLAVGRDYADISPMRGVIQGGNSHQLKVAVTVMPSHEIEAAQ